MIFGICYLYLVAFELRYLILSEQRKTVVLNWLFLTFCVTWVSFKIIFEATRVTVSRVKKKIT